MVEVPRTQYAKSDGLHVAYQVLGEGPPDLLLIAGVIPIDMYDEQPSVARFHRRLASFSRLVRFHSRGMGLSDPVAPADAPTLEQHMDDALAVMDAAGIARGAVFATLWHTSDAISLVTSYPERVSHLIIVNGTARVAPAPDYPIGIPSEVTAEYNNLIFEPDAVQRGFDALALMNPSVAHDPVYRDWWDRAGNRGASPTMARAISDLYIGADVRHLVSSVRTPTLIVHRRDTNPAGIVPVAAGRYLAEHIPDATYVELEGADQSYWLGDTEAMLDAIEEFLTGSHQAPEGDLVTATILFTDIVASTEQSARLGHRRWTALTDAHDTMVRATLGRHRGREIKTIGDAFLATFDATTRAVRAATEIVTAAEGMGLQVRAGVHTGEVEIRPDDVIGLAVTIAKRICDLAGPGEVMVSEAVKLQLTGSEIALSDQGARALKGVPDEWRLFSVKN